MTGKETIEELRELVIKQQQKIDILTEQLKRADTNISSVHKSMLNIVTQLKEK